MFEWLAPLEAVALSLVAGSLLLRVAILRPDAAAALESTDALTVRFASPTWLPAIVRWPALFAGAAAAARSAAVGSFVGLALATLASGLALAWAAVPIRRLDDLSRQWTNSADEPDLIRLASIERLDRTLAVSASLAALVTLSELLVG